MCVAFSRLLPDNVMFSNPEKKRIDSENKLKKFQDYSRERLIPNEN